MRSRAAARVPHPNATPRSIVVIALDPMGEAAVRLLRQATWHRTRFELAADYAMPVAHGRFDMQTWLRDLQQRTARLVADLRAADIVVMVCSTNVAEEAVSLLGEACAARGVMATAVVITGQSISDAALAAGTARVRPHAKMIAVAEDESYIRSLLRAFGA